jgi:hypothetical protein
MSVCMATRIRLIIDTTEEIRLAVRLAATKANKSPSEIVNDLIRRTMAGEIKDARRYIPPRKPEPEE